MLFILLTMLNQIEDEDDKNLLRRLINKAKSGSQIYLVDFDGLKDTAVLDLFQDKFEVSANYNSIEFLNTMG